MTIKLLFISLLSFSIICNANIALYAGKAIKGDSEKEKKTTETAEQNKIKKTPELTATVDRKQVCIGDFINLTLKYYLPGGSNFSSETQLKGLEEISIVERKITKEELKLKILIDKSKSFNIGPISLSFKDKEGCNNIIQTESIRIDIQSNFGDKPAEAQLKPIMDIVPAYPLWLKYLPWILGAVFIISIIFGIIYWKKRRLNSVEELHDLRPPHTIAREEIKKLQSMNLIDKGQYKEFYFRFSEILRQYIEKLRGFPAAESTTEEITKRIKGENDRKIIPILRDSDLVKFADITPTKAKNEEDIRNAFDYISDTAPISSNLQPNITTQEEMK